MSEEKIWASPERRWAMLRTIGLRIVLVVSVTAIGLWYALSIAEAKKEISVICRMLAAADTPEARDAIIATLHYSQVVHDGDSQILRAPAYPGSGQCALPP